MGLALLQGTARRGARLPDSHCVPRAPAALLAVWELAGRGARLSGNHRAAAATGRDRPECQDRWDRLRQRRVVPEYGWGRGGAGRARLGLGAGIGGSRR